MCRCTGIATSVILFHVKTEFMDVKNILIPAGLLYYSYSSNEELKAIIEQQKAAIQQQITIINGIKGEIKTIQEELQKQGNQLNSGNAPGSPNIAKSAIRIVPTLKVADLYGTKCDCSLSITVYYSPSEVTEATPALRILGMAVCTPGFILETEKGSVTLGFVGIRDYGLESTRNPDSTVNGLNVKIYPKKYAVLEDVLCEKDYSFFSDKTDSKKLRDQLLAIHNEIRVSEGKSELKYYSSLGSTVVFPNAGKVTVKLLCMKAGLPASLQWLTFHDLPFRLIRYNDLASKKEKGTIIPVDDTEGKENISEAAMKKSGEQ